MMARRPSLRFLPMGLPVFTLRPGLAQPERAAAWQLPLTAEERTRFRGRRLAADGQPLLLQLPRGEPLQPGEWLLAPQPEPLWLQVQAAPEPLLHVRSAEPLALLQAAYHLGNRHVALEIRPDALRLLQDPVLEQLLLHRGLSVERLTAPFLPEVGAYGGHSHSHGLGNHGPGSHGHTHAPSHSHSHGHAVAPAQDPSDSPGRRDAAAATPPCDPSD
jgi:urease accessory protein